VTTHNVDCDGRRAGSSIQSVSRALDLLEALSREELGLVELGRRTGLQPSTTHRMLATLADRGYVCRDDHGRYTLSQRAAYLGGVLSVGEREMMAAVRPLMQRIQTVSRETVHLTVLEGTVVVFVYEMVDCKRLHASIHDNFRVPAHASASGKALLAYRGSGRPVGPHCPDLRPLTRNTIVDRHHLWRELEKVREQGFAVDHQEYRPDVSCVASPIFDRNEQVVAGISVSGPSSRVRPELHADLGELVLSSAREASAALGPPAGRHAA
jgi:DNA-binding IclR family transcriptional regulator